MGATYEPVCEIARGGMATVSLVVRREGSFVRPYALKRLRPELATDPAVRAMFTEEARLAGRLRHPNVVSVLDVGEDAAGPFLVLDYVEGASIAALVVEASARDDVLPVQVALRILTQIARGLAAAHELTGVDGAPLRLVHRDVSPQNILIDLDGVVRVADFGIARAVGSDSLTTTGMLKGKRGYFSPEQLRFEPIDQRSDLFAFGVVMYELLTGRRLYRGADVSASARRILHEAPPDLGSHRPDLPDELVRLGFQLLAKQPELRPPCARDVARQLEEILVDVTALEGAIELDQYVREHLDVADIRRRRELMARAPEPAPASGAADVAFSAGGAPQASDEGFEPRLGASRARPWLAVGVLAAGVALAAGVGALALSGRLDDEPARPESALAEPAAPERAPEVPSPAALAEPLAETAPSPQPAEAASPAPGRRTARSSTRRPAKTTRPPSTRSVRPARQRGARSTAEPSVPVVDVY